ncbi:cytospin-A isoform X4 [Hydra vulgaris]|uniref:cytospin-A isoform X4 n=1 Tax=Hydra vulgaris TaxID=6087 RepID=UPI001F5E6202|nr:cytospin-A isoform X2 [Hydra vulgaris]
MTRAHWDDDEEKMSDKERFNFNKTKQMADLESVLKKKLENTDDLEERREIRKQIRELRNKKFDEEIKKISSGESTTLSMTNGSSKRAATQITSGDDDGDPYGLLKYTTEEELQTLLNATEFTETDKRRKIRTRMREVREAKYDSPIVIKSNERSSKSNQESIKESLNPKETDNYIKQQKTQTVEREPIPTSVIKNNLPSKTEPVYVRDPSPTPEVQSNKKEQSIQREPSLEREPTPEPECELNHEPELNLEPDFKEESNTETTEESYNDTKCNYNIEKDIESDKAISYNKDTAESDEGIHDTKDVSESDDTMHCSNDVPDSYETVNDAKNENEDEEQEDREEHEDNVNSDEDVSGSDCFSEDGVQKNKYSTSSTGSYDGKKHAASIIEDVMAVPEPGVKSGKDFKKKLKKGAVKSPVNLEKNSASSGEQVDFRPSLKKKSSAPVVNLERKLQGGEQVDFRTALQRKVELPAPEKKELAGGEQVDFRTALKQKVPKPVFDKTPISPQQVDFRTALSNKVQPKSSTDKPQGGEQKDFRVVLKAEPNPVQLINKVKPVVTKGEQKDFRTVLKKNDSPATAKKEYQTVDDDQNIDEKHNEDCEFINDEPKAVEINEDQCEQEVELEDTELVKSSQVVASQQDVQTKPVSKPPPPAPKKKSFKGKSEEPPPSNKDNNVNNANLPSTKEEEVEDVDGKARNRRTAKEVKLPPPKPTDKPRRVIRHEESEPVPVEVKNDVEKAKVDVKVPDNDSHNVEVNAEEPDDQSSQQMPTDNSKEKQIDKSSQQIPTVDNSKVSSLSSNVAQKKPSSQSKAMGRIKFGSDDEQEKPKEVEVKSTDNAETVKFNGNVKDDDGIKPGRRSRKVKEDETIEVSADLLAEINRPKEEPKKFVPPAAKTLQSTRVLTGKAAEREAERQKEREQREAERLKREAERAKERDEAARKRKEQKDAFEKKMEEKKKERMLAERKKNASVIAGRNAFKDKLEANAPPQDPNAAKVTSNTNVTKLLAWAQKQTMGYQGVNIENFSESWADGLAFAALIHSFCPEDIPIEELSKDTKRRNFELAFSIAKEEGVMDLLDVEDMVRMRSPDPKSIITYLHSVYSVFCS